MLTPRMKCVAALVPASARVADIGCDHAYISIALCEQEVCDFVIAMDVRRGPLEIAIANVHKAGLDDRIELRLSDGLEKLSAGEVDTVVIAGMGGLLIRDILMAGVQIVEGLHTMILQPQSEIPEVRRYVRCHGFEITDEAMVWDRGKPYFVMKCECAHDGRIPEWSDVEYRYGGVLLKRRDAGLKDFLQREQMHFEKLICELKKQLADNENSLSERHVKLEGRLTELLVLLEYNRQAEAYYIR